MAVLDHVGSFGPSLLSRLSNGARSFLQTFVDARTRSAQFEYYQNLSDSELAAKGLRREDIALHIFRDLCI